MSPKSSSSSARRSSMKRSRHIADYIAVVRNHWFSASIVFPIVFLAMLTSTLLATPVYHASATIQIDTSKGNGGLISNLAAMEGPSQVDTEMEVMRSLSVARYAAEHLMGVDMPEQPVGQTLPVRVPVHEEHAFRPLEVALRGIFGGWQPCRLEVRTGDVGGPVGLGRFRFEFDETGGGATIFQGQNEIGVRVHDAHAGPFEAHGRRFQIEVLSGDPASRTYIVLVRGVEEAARWIRGSIVVTPVGRRTGIVKLGFNASTPHLAQEVANALAHGYPELRRVGREDDFQRGLEWLDGEITRLTQTLERAEKARDEFASKNNAIQLDSRATWLLESQTQAKVRLAEFEYLKQEVEWELARWSEERPVETQLVLLGSMGTDVMTSALAANLAELRRRRAVLIKEGNKPEYPLVRQVDADIQSTTDQLTQAVGVAVREKVATLRQRVGILNARIAGVEKEAKIYDEQLSDMPDLVRELAIHLRAVEATRLILDRMVENQMELEISSKSGRIMAKVLDVAELPAVRKSPHVLRRFLLALVLALACAVGITFFLEYIDQRIRSPQALEKGLGLPLYAAVPAFGTVRRKDRKGMKGALVTVDIPNSVLSEAYRSLRANIRFADPEHAVHSLAITSAVQQEGKTVTTLNLAIVMAQAGNKVVVVDADMRRPATHHHLGGEVSPGLTDVLEEKTPWAQVLRPTPVENLWLIPAGERPTNPGALLDSEAFSELLSELTERYEYVLFDVPPVLAVSDAASFFRQLDAVFMLTRDRRCSIEVVDGAREQVDRLGGRVLGTIFNGFDARRSARGGYGYYGYYGYHGYYARYGAYEPSDGGKKKK